MATPTGDIKLSGTPYRIDLRSYRKRDMVDFSPRAQTPTGSIVMSELGLYQPVVQEDWRHGFGFHWHEDAAGYLKTVGYVETGMEGIVMLYTAPTTSEAIDTSKTGFVNFNSKLWAWGTSGLRSYSSGSWSDEYSTATVNFALATKDYLFYCPDGARIRKVDTGGAHTDAGNDTNSNDYRWLIIHNGYIYAGKDGTSYIHRDNSTDLSDLEGTTADPNLITAGGGGLATLGAIEYGGKMYISRSDGLWVLGEDLVCRRVVDVRNEASSDNFRSMAVHVGYLVYPIRDQLYQWNGVRVTTITPSKVTDTFPYTTYGRFDNLVTMGEYMYCTARTNEASYTESLLRFDGTSWTRLADLATGGSGTISGTGYDVDDNRLWYHNFKTGGGSFYIQMQDQSVFPYAAFPTTGTHSLYTSRLHMGFKVVYKSTPSLRIEATNLSESHYYIKVFYRLNGGGTWIPWGGIDEYHGIDSVHGYPEGTDPGGTYYRARGNLITDDGVTELINPLGSDHSTLEYYNIQLRFDFVTDDAAQSPILEAYTLRFLMRPEVFFGWNFDIIVEEGYQYGTKQDDREVATMLDALETARNSKAPITFEDVFGVTHYGYITAINQNAQERYEEDLGPTTNIAHVANVSVTQVG